jgi:hypothetical protein
VRKLHVGSSKLTTLGLMGLAIAAAGPANAQVMFVRPLYAGPPPYAPYYAPAPALAPAQITALVHRAGFAPLGAPIRRGPTYFVLASSPAGEVSLVINAYGGRILAVRPALHGPPLPAEMVQSPAAPTAGAGVPSNHRQSATREQETIIYRPTGTEAWPMLPPPPRDFPPRLATAPEASKTAPAKIPLPKPRLNPPPTGEARTTAAVPEQKAQSTVPETEVTGAKREEHDKSGAEPTVPESALE